MVCRAWYFIPAPTTVASIPKSGHANLGRDLFWNEPRRLCPKPLWKLQMYHQFHLLHALYPFHLHHLFHQHHPHHKFFCTTVALSKRGRHALLRYRPSNATQRIRLLQDATPAEQPGRSAFSSKFFNIDKQTHKRTGRKRWGQKANFVNATAMMLRVFKYIVKSVLQGEKPSCNTGFCWFPINSAKGYS